MTVLAYLKEQLTVDGDFLKEYKRLSEAEKVRLKESAMKEMGVLGIEIDAPKK